MTADAGEACGWQRRRWWTAVVLVFGLQIGLIFWLSDPTPIKPRVASGEPGLHLLPAGHDELLELVDPTLFALPQFRGFSGPAWMHVAQPEFRPADWTEAPRWLPLATNRLGATFDAFLRTNIVHGITEPAQPQPEWTLPSLITPAGPPAFSTVRVEGELDDAQLLTRMTLGLRPYSEALTNSVVQAVVDARGQPVSVTLLSTSSDPGADVQALEQTRTARFSPLPGGSAETPIKVADLRWATLVFNWQTLPVPATNNPGSP